MIRIVYSCLFYLVSPFCVVRLLWRARKTPSYLDRWYQRFAVYSSEPLTGVIWFHAVSVGEVVAVTPLIKRIRTELPEQPILVTTTTPTGSARVTAEFAETVGHVYLPYDLPDCVKRFLGRFKPRLAIVVETEIWPNLFHYCGQSKIPLIIINARLSESSVRGYKKLPAFIDAILANVTLIAAQTEKDADRFHELGLDWEKVDVTGNIKFDSPIPTSLISEAESFRQKAFLNRPVWIAASTHGGEEDQILASHQELRKIMPELVLVLVPRHPERCNGVLLQCKKRGLKVVLWSENKLGPSTFDVLLVDTIGELKLFYAVSDIAFVGGSLIPIGGHNIIEPASLGVPVIFGLHMSNFEAIAGLILDAKAGIQVVDKKDLIDQVLNLFQDESRRRKMGNNARLAIEGGRGALDRVFDLLLGFIKRG